MITPISISFQLYILHWRTSRTQIVFPSLSHAVMLQPAALRVAGGHSRQGAEPCWRLNQRLAHIPLPRFLSPLSFHPSFSFIHPVARPLQLSFIPSTLAAYLTLVSLFLWLAISSSMPTQTVAGGVWHLADVQQVLPLTLLVLQHSKPNAPKFT